LTYCVGFYLEDGWLMAQNSRTNAGDVDYISSYRKLHVFQPSPIGLFILAARRQPGHHPACLN